ncbi:hypothetical protein ACQ859_07060 [Roseateles chitinivorans]|uniref:hypothetical protein n=1 Tax=Roseateles chitinivorans TaxID=2917965 RepID=UPI003D66A44F
MTASPRCRVMLALLGVAGATCMACAGSVRAASVEVHPAGDTVPENLLRIELRFQQPQRLPFDMRRLTLLDEQGEALENALLDLALPNADGRRITVLMDPGRVKSGAGPNRDAGRALHAGRRVSLRVAADAGDASGAAAVKTWRVTDAVSSRLAPADWRLTTPRARSREALVVDFRDAVSASGEELIAVTDAAGQRLAGTTSLTRGDSVWRFTPSRRWKAGRHRLVVYPEFEDPAGNRPCAAFEEQAQSSTRCEATRRDFDTVTPGHQD